MIEHVKGERTTGYGTQLVQLIQPDSGHIDQRPGGVVANPPVPVVQQPLQQRQLGRHLITVLQSRNLLKGPWVTMAKFIGPRRAMKQAASFGAENSPVKLSVREVSSQELEITVDEGQQTEFLAGLLEALVGMLGGKNARVATVSTSETQTVFNATWR